MVNEWKIKTQYVIERRKPKNRFIAWFKKRKSVILALLIVAGVFALYFILKGLGEELRGYKATGGEIFIFFIPFIIVLIRDLVHEVVDLFK